MHAWKRHNELNFTEVSRVCNVTQRLFIQELQIHKHSERKTKQ